MRLFWWFQHLFGSRAEICQIFLWFYRKFKKSKKTFWYLLTFIAYSCLVASNWNSFPLFNLVPSTTYSFQEFFWLDAKSFAVPSKLWFIWHDFFILRIIHFSFYSMEGDLPNWFLDFLKVTIPQNMKLGFCRILLSSKITVSIIFSAVQEKLAKTLAPRLMKIWNIKYYYN